MPSGVTLLLVVTGIVLVLGTVAALVWWTAADYFFPGTSRKTGQRILPGKSRRAAPGEPTVVRFDEPPPPHPPAGG
jgi:hypothetical protein